MRDGERSGTPAPAPRAAVQEVVGRDAGAFFATDPHGYADRDQIHADVTAGGLDVTALDTITVEGRAESARALAVGYCTGTPLRAELVSKTVDFDAAVTAVAAAFEARLGTGPVIGRMGAHVVESVAAG